MLISEKLKTYREKFGYSQADVAKKLKCSQSLISSYELNNRLPSLDNLVTLAKLYRVSTDELLGIGGHSPNSIDLSGLSEEDSQAIRVLVNSLSKIGEK